MLPDEISNVLSKAGGAGVRAAAAFAVLPPSLPLVVTKSSLRGGGGQFVGHYLVNFQLGAVSISGAGADYPDTKLCPMCALT